MFSEKWIECHNVLGGAGSNPARMNRVRKWLDWWNGLIPILL